MKVQKNGFLSIEQLQDRYLKQSKTMTSAINTDGKSFQEILETRQALSPGRRRGRSKVFQTRGGETCRP